MELVLWRHADAEDGHPDMKRELTDKGRRQSAKMAAWLRPRMDGKWTVLVSPAVRARQTADALERNYDVRLTLGHLETEDALLREAQWPDNDRNILVVGHQPTFGRVAARLLTGHRGDLTIKKASVWWFSSRLDEEVGVGETLLRSVIGADLVE